jgi:hypothetical protein
MVNFHQNKSSPPPPQFLCLLILEYRQYVSPSHRPPSLYHFQTLETHPRKTKDNLPNTCNNDKNQIDTNPLHLPLIFCLPSYSSIPLNGAIHSDSPLGIPISVLISL